MMRVVAVVAAAAISVKAEEGAMRESFNALERFAWQLPFLKYDETRFKAITDCMATAGPTLYPQASDAAWAGLVEFGVNGGSRDDPWAGLEKPWLEYDPRNLTYKGKGISVIEPCNTVSNLAFYRILPDWCASRKYLKMDDDHINAIIQGFATLGMGSAFMHASRTELGTSFDVITIDVIAYQYFQWMTASLPPSGSGSSSVLFDLSPTPRAYDGRVLATKLHTIPLELGVNDWNAALQALDRPQYYVTFSSIIVTALTLVVPNFIMDELIPLLIGVFGIDDEVKEFILEGFVPTIRAATASVNLSLSEKAKLVPKLAGTVIKLLWAFVWQVEIFRYDFLDSAIWNSLGALLIPAVNHLTNMLTGFHHADASIQKSQSIYPGQTWCNLKRTAPHAKWHEISANGVTDLGYFADAIRTSIDSAQARQSLRVNGDGSEEFVTMGLIDDFVSEMKKQPFSDSYVTTLAFAYVVKSTVSGMDKCNSGKSDGSITWKELTCYLTNIPSAADFLKHLFEEINVVKSALEEQGDFALNEDAILV